MTPREKELMQLARYDRLRKDAHRQLKHYPIRERSLYLTTTLIELEYKKRGLRIPNIIVTKIDTPPYYKREIGE
ncbi:hypothetical protein LCGC14_2160330 [marine sediment metagenome]|uniref:Uncharacterized protein n=1 Tax=marine sediment metagenome TaxID=412755 RepID=A0A0F9EF90_9ZZZZ